MQICAWKRRTWKEFYLDFINDSRWRLDLWGGKKTILLFFSRYFSDELIAALTPGPKLHPTLSSLSQLKSIQSLFINHPSSLSLIKLKKFRRAMFTWRPAWWQTWLCWTWETAPGLACTPGSLRKIVLNSFISDNMSSYLYQSQLYLCWCKWPCRPPSWLRRMWLRPACSGSHKESRPSGSAPSRYHWKMLTWLFQKTKWITQKCQHWLTDWRLAMISKIGGWT